MRSTVLKTRRSILRMLGCMSAAAFSVLFVFSPTPAKAVCVQNGKTIQCDGFDTDGFVSLEDSLSVTIDESGIIRNILSVVRRGLCPLSFPAIVTGSSSDITNNGLILTFGVCGSGIQTGSDTVVTNNGTIDTFDVLSLGVDVGANSRIFNEGQITTRGFVSAGVFAGDGSTIINSATGLIETNGTVGPGVLTQGRANIMNAGTIRTTGVGSNGIQSAGDGIFIANSGQIEVSGLNASGIRFGGETGQINNSGTITGTYDGPPSSNGREDGISASGTQVSVVNSGRIAMTSAFATGVRLAVLETGTATVTNTGDISSSESGIFIGGASGLVAITNSGSISSANGPAVDLSTAVPSLALVSNQGTLSSAGDANALQGGAGREEVLNTGFISGGLDLAGGNDLLTLQTGATFAGTIDGGTGFDDLVLTGDGSLNAETTGFEELTKFGNGKWQITVDVTFSERARVLEGVLAISRGTQLTSNRIETFSPGRLALDGTLTGSVTNGGTLEIATAGVINGDFTQTSSGSLIVNTAAGGNDPALDVIGSANLDGRLRVVFGTTDPLSDGTEIIAVRAGSISGRFSGIDYTTGGFVVSTPFVEGNLAGARFARLPYETAARSLNSGSIARILDTNLQNSPKSARPLFAALDALSVDDASDLLGALSSNLPSVLVSQDLLATRAAIQELTKTQSLEDSGAWRTGTWGAVNRTNGSLVDGDGSALDREATRYAAGALLPISDNAAFSIGLSQTDYDATASPKTLPKRAYGQNNLFGAALHGKWKKWSATAGLAIGTTEGGHSHATAQDADSLTAAVGSGTTLAASGRVSRSDQFGLFRATLGFDFTYVKAKRDGTTEGANSLWALSYSPAQEASLRGGVSMTGVADLGRVSPRVRVGLSHEFNSLQRATETRFVVLPDTPFELVLRPEERFWVDSEIEIPFRPVQNVEISLRAGGVLNDKTGGHHIGMRALWLW